MKMLKNLVFILISLGTTMMFTSCGDDNDGDINLVKDGEIDSQNDDDLDPADLQGNVNADITLASTEAWILTGPLAVKSGATLTIEAGTVILAEAGGNNVYIVVETGGKIEADGTSSPIILTSAAATPGNGDWGGVLINGLAPISGPAGTVSTSTTEVLPLSYGGDNPNDDSGTFKNVILEYTGARINGEKEFNGLTLYGVGAATDISNLVIIGGDDDAIEWFGGTVEVDNILVINARDDMFDWTQGYKGGGSNWFGIREDGFDAVSEDPRGIEGDGNLDGETPGDANQSDVTVDKITIYHGSATIAAGATAPVEMSDMIKVRRGSNATITNAMIALGLNAAGDGTGGIGDMVDLNDSKGSAAGTTSVTYWYNNHVATYATPDDVNAGANNGTISTSAAATGADASVFSWAGAEITNRIPTLTPASAVARQ